MQTNKWYSIKQQADAAEVMIYDEIGQWGITAKQFAADFGNIKASTINIRINSAGGDVFDGLAVYQTIRAHPAETVVTIDGLAASIASIIALGGKKVKMAENAYMMIHNPWTMAMGDAAELRKQADVLEKLSATSADIYAAKSKKSTDDCRAMMNAETWMDAKQALEMGFCDSIVDGNKEVVPAALAKAMLKFNPPEKLRKIAASLIQRSAEQDLEEQQRQEAEYKDAMDFLKQEIAAQAASA